MSSTEITAELEPDPPAGTDTTSGDRAPLPQRRQAVVFLSTFVGLLVLFQLFFYSESAQAEGGLVHTYRVWMTHAAAWLLDLLGHRVRVMDTRIFGPRNTGLYVMAGCDGLQVMAAFAAAIVGFPVRLSSRVYGLVIGSALLVGTNVVRVATLYLSVKYTEDLTDTFHHYAWPAALIFFGLVLFFSWAAWALKRSDRAAPLEASSGKA